MKKIDACDKVIFICDGKKCSRHSKDLRKGFKEAIKENGLKKKVDLVCMDCTGNCKTAPNICLQPHNIWIGEVEKRDIQGVVKKYFL